MAETYTLNLEDNKIYGIWIPGEGWLKGKDVFADTNWDKASQVARLIGHGAVVRFIDIAIIDLENRYLEQERRSIWHIFKNYFNLNKHK